MSRRRQFLAATTAATLALSSAGCLDRSRSSADDTPRTWPQFGRGAPHAAVAPTHEVPQTLDDQTTHPLDGDIATSPVAGRDAAFAADGRGLFVRPFDDQSPGHLQLPGETARVPAIDTDGRVVTTRSGSSGPVVVAVYPSGREIAWSRALDGRAVTAPAVADGVVYVGTDAGAVALSADDGTLRWRVDAGVTRPDWNRLATANLAPAVGDETVVFPTGDGVCGVARRGRIRWRVDGERIVSSPAIRGDTVYVPDLGTGLRAFELSTGRERWRHADPGTWATPALGDQSVFAGTAGGLAVLDRRDGSLERLLDYNFGLIPAAVARVGDKIVTSTRDAGLAIVLDVGQRAASLFSRGEGGFGAPAVAAGRCLFTEFRDDGFRLVVVQ